MFLPRDDAEENLAVNRAHRISVIQPHHHRQRAPAIVHANGCGTRVRASQHPNQSGFWCKSWLSNKSRRKCSVPGYFISICCGKPCPSPGEEDVNLHQNRSRSARRCKSALSVRAPASRTGSSGGNRDRSAATPRTGSRPTMSVACLCWSICFFSAAMYASSTLTSVLSSASWNRSLSASVARASEDSRSLTAMKPLASEFKSFAAAFRASE
jgi:hypothetical protein